MKIVSEFKDFYDYADGFSKEPVYVRKTKIKQFNHSVLITLGYSTVRITGIVRVGYKIYWSLSNGVFCESLNEVLNHVRSGTSYKNRVEREIYDERSNLSMVNVEPVECIIFADYNVEDSARWAGFYGRMRRIENPQLSRHFDPLLFPLTKEQICQEITAWLYNYPVDSRPIPKIDDVTLAESKGYNKYSFRKERNET